MYMYIFLWGEDYLQNWDWNFIMLFVNAVFNVFTGDFGVMNCVSGVLSNVRQINVAAVLLFLYSIICCKLIKFVLFCMVLCKTLILLLVFQIIFF